MPAKSSSSAAPEVTVVIPTRNRRQLLSRALASVLAQEDVAIEVIVVDDASADGTLERINGLDDERVRLLRNETPRGPAAARNQAIDLARAPWLGFLDDDDLWAPRKLREQLDLAADDVVLVDSGHLSLDEQGRVLARFPGSDDAEKELLRRDVFGTSGVIVRTDAVRAVGGFDESLQVVEDWDLWIRLLGSGRMIACHDPLWACTLTSSAASINPAENLAGTKRLLIKHASLGIDVDLASSASWVATGQRRAGHRLWAARTLLSSGLRYRSPRNVARGLALILLGESGMRAQRRIRQPRLERPGWLDPERKGTPEQENRAGL